MAETEHPCPLYWAAPADSCAPYLPLYPAPKGNIFSLATNSRSYQKIVFDVLTIPLLDINTIGATFVRT